MRVIKNIAGFFLMVAFLMLLVGFFLPGKIVVSRSIPVNASREVVFEQINKVENWKNWSELHQDKVPGTRGISDLHTAGIVSSIPNEVVISKVRLDSGVGGRLTWNLVTKGQNTVLVESSVEIDLGMSPVSRYRGLLMNHSITTEFENDLGRLRDICEKLGREG